MRTRLGLAVVGLAASSSGTGAGGGDLTFFFDFRTQARSREMPSEITGSVSNLAQKRRASSPLKGARRQSVTVVKPQASLVALAKEEETNSAQRLQARVQ